MSLLHDGPEPTAGALSFLAGGGEMGERIRAFHWAATSLGPPEGWPQSLKTSIRIMLMSRQPVWIGWGDDLLYFYNDPYLAIIGGKHPGALGRPTRDVWREIWDVIAPMLATAMSGDEGTYVESQLLVMERNGYPEETYYTFSYSPIPDDEGRPGGIFCANSDDTGRVLGQRELALLRELAARTAKCAGPDEACERSLAALATDPADVPFAAIYLVDEARGEATLRGAVGIPEGHRLAPRAIALDRYPKALTEHAPELIESLGDPADVPRGAWPIPPAQAIVLPLEAAGEATRGLLVLGLSPYRLLAGAYQGFLELVAGAVSAAVADAEATERERRRLEALAELDRAKTAFFANVSHEFRTPLTLMLGPLQDVLAADRGAIPDRVRLELETVHRNGRRLQRLVNTLLDFSRLEAGRMRAGFRPTDLAVFTAELASAFDSLVQKADLRLVVDCPPLPPEARAYVDRDLWEKVVLNLVSNAFKHTFEGEIRVAVALRGGAVELTVADTGIGIPPADLARVFERFRRVEGSRSRTHEGSGIGLALVQEIVRLHGGEIAASSETDGPNRGTVFTVRIPLGRDHLPTEQVVEDAAGAVSRSAADAVGEAMGWLPDTDEEGTPASNEADVVPLRTAGARIVLADDNADMRGYVGRLLAPHYRVEAVVDGQAALEAIHREMPDLVVTDVMMPRLDGFGLVQAVRGDEATATIPVIMLSARAGEEATIEGLDAGADDYLVKPFSARELLARVDSALALARVRQEVGETQRRSERRLREAFGRAPAIIALLKGPEHVFDLANPRYLEHIGGKALAEVLGRPVREVLPEVVDQGFVDLLDRVYSTEEPFFGDEMLVRLQREGRLEDVWLNFVYLPTRDAEERVDGIFVHAIDVTEQVLARRRVEEVAHGLEESVRQRTVELLQANEQLQGFTYSVAHDLRQQIRGISTNAAIVLMDAGEGLDDESRDRLGRLERAARQLGVLVDDLLGYARLGAATPKSLPVDLSAIAREVAAHLQEIEECGADTEFVVGPTPPTSGDPAMLRIVLSNLLGNACKYSRQTARPRVEFGHDGRAYFVRDNGAGFDMAFAHKLFVPFERLHADDSFGGTGIGLANVRRIVEKHGGTVWAEGEPGEGATFWFTLA